MAPTQTRSRSLPENPSEEYLRKEAKRLARDEAIQLAAAQRKLAREYGFSNWTELIGHVRSVSAASKSAQGPDAAAQRRSTLNELLKRPLYELPLSQRAFAGLQHENVRYIGELIQRTEHDLLEIKNFGRKSLNEIKKVLAEMGISLGVGLEVENVLPFLPLRGLIAFPHVVYPVFVGRRMSINAIKSADNRKIPIAMAAQKDPSVESPGDADIYRTGVVGTLIKVEELPDGTLKALIEGKRRVRVSQLKADGEFLEAKTEELTEPATEDVEKLLESVASAFVFSGHFKSLTTHRSVFLSARSTPSTIADRVASHLPIEISEKQALLELLNPAERLEKLVVHLNALG
jgi:Lon protease-like protein